MFKNFRTQYRVALKQTRRFSTEPPKKGNGLKIGIPVAVAVAALGGYYYYTKQDNNHGRKLKTIATAAYLSPMNAHYSEEPLWTSETTQHGQEDYQQVYNAIAKKIQDEDEYDGGIGYGPVLVRLAWHASGSYDKNDTSVHKGGSYGGTMAYKHEASDPGNNGLKNARDFLAPIQTKFPWISRGDLYTLAGVTAIQEMSGPKIPWRPGRVNLSEDKQPPYGRLPDAAQGATHVRNVFHRLGFLSDEDIVALIGVGHAIGKCHPENTGYDGPWTFSPNMVTNQFFDLIVNEEWQIKKWDGPTQFEDKKTQSLMMLPADFSLMFDPKFKKICQEFAKDEAKLFKVFSSAFSKLLEAGIKFPASQPQWTLKTLDEQDE